MFRRTGMEGQRDGAASNVNWCCHRGWHYGRFLLSLLLRIFQRYNDGVGRLCIWRLRLESRNEMLFANQRAKGQLDMIWKSNNLWISQNICEKKAEVKLYRIKFWPIKVPGIAKKNKRKWDMSFSSIQLLSHVQLFATPWTAECQASLSITNSQSLLKTHVHWVSDAIQPSQFPLLLPTHKKTVKFQQLSKGRRGRIF